jgi:uncharacterized repeat protein (TIGR02543 family)
MKMIPKLRKHNYLTRIGIFLIALALIVGTVSCEGDGNGNGNGEVKYSLTMAVAPPAGGTATDLTNASPYTANTTVNITAAPNPGYQFVSWTSSDGGTFGNATALTTNFTMPAQNVIVTANFVRVYNLTMAVTPPGSGNATDFTGASPYPAGTPVAIQAVANPPYQFFNWTAPAGTFTNATAAQTIFTMPAQDVNVTAHFVGPLDHFKCYEVDYDTAPYIGEVVYLEDQFGAINATVGKVMAFGNPATKQHEGNVTPIWNPDYHLTFYYLDPGYVQHTWQVEVNNQFGNNQTLSVYGPYFLAVPTQKESQQEPMGLDHFLLYMVTNGPAANAVVNLTDQFHDEQGVSVTTPVFFANPVRKTHNGNVTEVENSEEHLVFYEISGGTFQTQVLVDNQFGEQNITVDDPYLLAVPSEKIDWVQQLSHFKFYSVEGAPYVGENVTLVDQFVAINATVGEALFFANPVEKTYNDVWTPISDHRHHLTIYNITCEAEPQYWAVEVRHQFRHEWMSVYGPVALAVPTQKEYHEKPVGLNHFLIYLADGRDVNQFVDLFDQFWNEYNVQVGKSIYFANPVQKTHGGNVTEIENSEEHLVFYDIYGAPPSLEISVSNQLGEQSLNLSYAQLLAVPSEKIDWYPFSPP